MDDRKFDITLQIDGMNNELQLRFYSNTQVELQIRDIKAFYGNQEYISLLYRRINLSNDFKTTSLGLKVGEYKTITLIAKNITHKEQYAVSIPLNGDEIIYTQMFYEGI